MTRLMIEAIIKDNMMTILMLLFGGLGFALRLQFGEKRLSERQVELRHTVEGLKDDVGALKTKVAVLEEKHEGVTNHIGDKIDGLQSQLTEIFRRISTK